MYDEAIEKDKDKADHYSGKGIKKVKNYLRFR